MFNPGLSLEDDEVPVMQRSPPPPANLGGEGGVEGSGGDPDPLGEVDESGCGESEGG